MDYLYLVWKDPTSRRNYTIGKLSKGEKYSFSYLPEAEDAKKCGWEYISAFPKNISYESEIMFPAFSSRLPDRKRRDIDTILRKYGLSSYDEFELLGKSGARLPIDTYQFVLPIPTESESVEIEFFVVGIRYISSCGGNNCGSLCVNLGDPLFFAPEPDNKYDQYAIRIHTQEGEKLGYVPRFYNQEILNRIRLGSSYTCVVKELGQGQVCSDCVKVHLSMPSLS